MAARLLCHCLTLAGGEIKRLAKAFGQAAGIHRRGKPARLAMDNRLCRPAMVESHHQAAHGLCLQRHAAERLGRDRGHGDDIRRHQRRRHVIDAMRQPETALEPQPHAGLCQPVHESLLAVRRAKQNADERPVGDLCQSLQQNFMTFPCRRPCRQHDHRLVFGKRNGVDKADDPRLRHSGRIEHHGIHTALDDGQLAALLAELALDLRFHIARDRDDMVGRQHLAVEDALQRACILEAAMHRADRYDAKQFGGGKRDLRRHARAHMHNIGALLLQDALDAAAQARPGKRVLHPDGKRVVNRVDPVEMPD